MNNAVTSTSGIWKIKETHTQTRRKTKTKHQMCECEWARAYGKYWATCTK